MKLIVVDAAGDIGKLVRGMILYAQRAKVGMLASIYPTLLLLGRCMKKLALLMALFLRRERSISPLSTSKQKKHLCLV